MVGAQHMEMEKWNDSKPTDSEVKRRDSDATVRPNSAAATAV